MHLGISFFTLLFDHTAIYNFTVLIIFVLLFDRCLLVTFGDFVVVPMTPSESRGYQIISQSFDRPLDRHVFYGGFHLHLLVFPFIYQFNSRIGIVVNSSFAND